jgi:hypothetical protein
MKVTVPCSGDGHAWGKVEIPAQKDAVQDYVLLATCSGAVRRAVDWFQVYRPDTPVAAIGRQPDLP